MANIDVVRDVTRMQDGAGRRVIATALAVTLLVAGLLGLHHEADVAHVRDTAGVEHHAHELAERHELSATPHLHGRAAHTGTDTAACALLAALDHPATVGTTQAIADLPPPPDVTHDQADQVGRAVTIPYRIAPKTSPPGRG